MKVETLESQRLISPHKFNLPAKGLMDCHAWESSWWWTVGLKFWADAAQESSWNNSIEEYMPALELQPGIVTKFPNAIL